ncbi:MAG TPA: TIGR03086 family metal-binding protein [Acidimicrobiales bacterium]|nr:TIGR03086 family metal-binding protein [Acidimicrobiales bacterium]
METLDALGLAFEHTGRVVGGVTADQLGAATPCTEWEVRTLLSHMLAVMANCGRAARGEALVPGTALLEEDFAGQFAAEAGRTLAGWRACPADGMVDIGAGPMPVAAAMGINLLDTSIHGWDVARATGQDGTLPPELATTLLTIGPSIVTDELRAYAGFNPPVALAADAGPTDQLVAFLGRRP